MGSLAYNILLMLKEMVAGGDDVVVSAVGEAESSGC